jgi:hypothetical protein
MIVAMILDAVLLQSPVMIITLAPKILVTLIMDAQIFLYLVTMTMLVLLMSVILWKDAKPAT